MAIAALTNLMSVEEYLRTPFRPDVSSNEGVREWGGEVLMVAGTPIEFDPELAFAKMIKK